MANRAKGRRLFARVNRRWVCRGLLALIGGAVGGCGQSGADVPSGQTATPPERLPSISAVATPSSLPGPATPMPSATRIDPLPTATASAPAGSPTALPSPGPRKYGIQLLLDDDGKYPDPIHWSPTVWPQHLTYARKLVGAGGYAQELIRLDDLNVAKWQIFMAGCARENLVPIVRLASTYDHDLLQWNPPPTDADGRRYRTAAGQYRDFLAQLDWPTPTRYVIVGNEPNRGDEWGNQPDPAAYARFLADVGAALHEIGVTVLGPSLDNYAPNSNGQIIAGYRFLDSQTFLDELAAADSAALQTIDVWSSHAYPLGPFIADPSKQVFQIDYAFGAKNPHHQTPPPGIYNRGINSYRWDLWKAGQYLGDRAATLPVMITETGWRHRGSQDPRAKDSVNADVPDDLLAAYVDLAFRGNDGRYPNLPSTGWTPWNADPRVLGAVLFALDGYPRDWGHTNWLDLDASGNVSGVTPAFKLMSRWTGESPRGPAPG